jgi:hypothetical protein
MNMKQMFYYITQQLIAAAVVKMPVYCGAIVGRI